MPLDWSNANFHNIVGFGNMMSMDHSQVGSSEDSSPMDNHPVHFQFRVVLFYVHDVKIYLYAHSQSFCPDNDLNNEILIIILV